MKQRGLKPSEWDWSFLEYYRKAVDLESSHERKKGILHALRHCEATRDLWTESIKDIYPLIQFDPIPNQELREPKIELYKVSISFTGGNLTSWKYIYWNTVVYPNLKISGA